MIITRLCIDVCFGNRVMYWSTFDYHQGHLLTSSNQDQSAPFRRFSSRRPLPQHPAPLHLSYCANNKRGMGGFEQGGGGGVLKFQYSFLVLITKQYFFQDLYFKKYTCFSTNKAEYAKLLNALVFNVDKKKRRLKIKVVICTGKNLIKGYIIRNEKLIKDSMSFDFSQYSNTIKGQYPNRVVEHFNSTVQ